MSAEGRRQNEKTAPKGADKVKTVPKGAEGVNDMRRRMIAAAAGLAAALMIAGQVFGAENFKPVEPVTMYVTNAVNGVNLRTAPDLSASVDRVLYYNDAVTVVEIGDFWAKTERGGKNYYIAKEFLTTAKGGTAAQTAETEAAQTVEKVETVTAQPAETAAAESAETAAAQSAETTAAQTAETAAQSSTGSVEVESVSLNSGMRFAEFSAINSGAAKLYRNGAGAHGGTVVCVNAGHGTKGGESHKTLSHPDGTGKVTGGTNANGATKSMAISSGMDFADGTSEAKVNLRVALALRDELLARGYSVLMIREDDDQQLDNIARTVLANSLADCHIAIHFDSTGSDKGAFYMSVPDALKYLDPVSSTWQKSEAFGEALISGLRNRGVKIFSGGSMDMDLTQTSYSSVPSVDIELGDKVTDHGEAACRRFAEGLADGVEAYFN